MVENMKCSNCQKEIPADALLCPYCGTRIDSPIIPTRHSGFGITSLVLGILAAAFWWIPLVLILFSSHGGLNAQGFAFVWWLFLILPMAVLSIIFGPIAYFGKARDNFGLAGLILGIAILVLSIVFQILTSLLL